ncbi:MAG: DegV family protein [Oscillospiraceae bacterium]|nr:DegV family protein [Oscillospiraceae bacterium]
MRAFELLTDSSCDLPREIVEEFGITMLPMSFTLGGQTYHEDYWASITPDEFYTRVKSGEKSMTTLFNREAFVKVFSDIAQKGRDIVLVCLSGNISGTYENAVGAAEDVAKSFPERRVRVVDSINATIGHGLLVLNAALKGDDGMNADETADYLEEVKHKTYAFFTVDDLMFLHAGGRLSKFSAIAGSMLGVKPVLWVDTEGSLKVSDKKRGRKASLEWLVECMAKCSDTSKKHKFVTIAHGNCKEDGEYVKKLVEERFDTERVILTMLGAVIGSHSGPGTLAMFFEGDIVRTEFENNKK